MSDEVEVEPGPEPVEELALEDGLAEQAMWVQVEPLKLWLSEELVSLQEPGPLLDRELQQG